MVCPNLHGSHLQALAETQNVDTPCEFKNYTKNEF